jgi:hypothetical protein
MVIHFKFTNSRQNRGNLIMHMDTCQNFKRVHGYGLYNLIVRPYLPDGYDIFPFSYTSKYARVMHVLINRHKFM